MLPAIRIASPCTADWERMAGDDRARHCAQCNLDVYSLSAMTEHEIGRLIAATKGQRLCGRFYRRADGTILTRNCPVGFRTLVRRVSRIAGTALSAAMSVGFAVAQTQQTQKGSALTQIAPAESGIEVVVVDESGAVIPKAQVFVGDGGRADVAKGISDSLGEYRAHSLTPGSYVLTVSSPGFRTHAETISIRSRETMRLRVELGVLGAVMGEILWVSNLAPEPTPSTGVPDFLPEPERKQAAPVTTTAKGIKKSKTKPATK
jgi:hypothetical protein